MSLISAVEDRDIHNIGKTSGGGSRTSSITSSKKSLKHGSKSLRKPKVYQTTGEPLSREALYKAKLKYGVYQSPAQSYSIGVSDAHAASDKAANLAHDNQTTVEAYKRMFIDPNATKAASKMGPKVVRNNSITSATSKTSKESQTKRKSKESPGAAASKAYSMTMETTSLSSQTNSRSYSITSASSVLSGASGSFNSTVNPKPKTLNLEKVLVGAEKKAESRIKERWEPEKTNFQYGVKTDEHGNLNQFSFSNEMMNNIMAKVDAPKAQDLQKVKKVSAEKEAKSMKFALGAANAVKDMHPGEDIDKSIALKAQKRETYLSQLTSQQVLTLARANVDRQLDIIEKSDMHRKLFTNMEYNKAAVAVAQSNHQKKTEFHNKINMGGGLFLSPEDITKIASGLISPVLGEVSERAEAQRAMDEEIAERTEAYNKSLSEWETMERSIISNDAKVLTTTANRHQTEKKTSQEKIKASFDALVARMDTKVAERETLLEDTKSKEIEFKKQMQQELKDEKARLDQDLEEWGKKCEQDITEARKEQEELLKPYHDDLANAEAEHKTLVEERDAINAEISRLQDAIVDHKRKISGYGNDLDAQKNRNIREDDKLLELGQTKESLESHLNDDVIILANKAKEQAELSTKEARLKQLEVDSLINERKSELNATEIELKKEKLSLLEAMKDVASARGDDKIDEEKVKKLIGMTSEEYLTQNKSVEKNVEDLPTQLEKIEEGDELKKEEIVGAETKNSGGDGVPVSTAAKEATETSSAVQTKEPEEKISIGNKSSGKEDANDCKSAEHSKEISVSQKAGNNKSLGVSPDSLEHTFSGFSQGSSIEDDQDAISNQEKK
ncbi:BBM_1a_G0040490.mRNA.1.CDS.1 [Saccharomyces cerevisiae]|nr:Eis1p [Saccharomyces cerevisiae YJM1399]CAI4679818.1 BBM_1a_G0040490.mRNA.1.CDS.1 [Saccharomyces cerevisiae]CAI7265164.1 BBM_1a_G0040490.mRNA.1.CDS.1 [Saccharomyces cerevisiae]